MRRDREFVIEGPPLLCGRCTSKARISRDSHSKNLKGDFFPEHAVINGGILIMSTMNNLEVIKKSTRPPHFGECDNQLSFEGCYELIANDPGKIFHTTGNQTPFSARACMCKKGPHANDKVIIFFTKGTEKARAYSCCWGHITNCNRTYIDCFTKAIGRD